jgi:hypothetical protein
MKVAKEMSHKMRDFRKNHKRVFILGVSLIVVIILISSITLYEFFYIPPYKSVAVPRNVSLVLNESVMRYGLADRQTGIGCYPMAVRSTTEILDGTQSRLTLMAKGAVAVSSWGNFPMSNYSYADQGWVPSSLSSSRIANSSMAFYFGCLIFSGEINSRLHPSGVGLSLRDNIQSQVHNSTIDSMPAYASFGPVCNVTNVSVPNGKGYFSVPYGRIQFPLSYISESFSLSHVTYFDFSNNYYHFQINELFSLIFAGNRTASNTLQNGVSFTGYLYGLGKPVTSTISLSFTFPQSVYVIPFINESNFPPPSMPIHIKDLQTGSTYLIDGKLFLAKPNTEYNVSFSYKGKEYSSLFTTPKAWSIGILNIYLNSTGAQISPIKF